MSILIFSELHPKSMAKQFDSVPGVIDGAVSELMEMIAMPSVLLLRRTPVGSQRRESTHNPRAAWSQHTLQKFLRKNLLTLESILPKMTGALNFGQ